MIAEPSCAIDYELTMLVNWQVTRRRLYFSFIILQIYVKPDSRMNDLLRYFILYNEDFININNS